VCDAPGVHNGEPSIQALERDTADGQNVELVYERLRAAILRGELAPERALSQVQLAKELGVSRTPLREALRLLQREGLVEAEPNRRVRIAGFSVGDMEQIYLARIPLEAAAVRLSVPRMTSEEIAGLEGDLAQMAHFAAARDYERWEVPHRAFHRRLVAHAGARVAALLADLSDHAERYRRFYTTQVPRAWTSGVAEHRAIADAVAAGDADAAAARLVEHLAHTAYSTIDAVEPGYDPARLREAVAISGAPVSAAGRSRSRSRRRA